MFTEITTFRHAKYRAITGKWLGRFGVVVLFKPTVFAFGLEVIKRGVIFFAGPIAVGIGDPLGDKGDTP